MVNAMPRPFYPRQWPGTHCVGGCVFWEDMQKRKFITTTGFTLMERFPVVRYAEGFSRHKHFWNSDEFHCPILQGNFLTRWVAVSIKTRMQRGLAMVQAAIHWSVTAEGLLQSPTSLYGICGIQNGTGTGPSRCTFLFPFHTSTMLLTHLLIYHRLYIILRICNLVTWDTYRTRTYKIQERLTVVFSKSIVHIYIHTYIHTYAHTYSLHWSRLCINCIWIWNMSINIRQHKTHRKIRSQDKTVKQTKQTHSQE